MGLQKIVCTSVMCCLITIGGNISADGIFSPPTLFASKLAFTDNVYYVQSPSMSSPEKELAECFMRVAQQISIRKEVFVTHTLTKEKASDGKMYTKTQTNLEYNQTDNISIIEKLEVIRVIQTSTGTEALVKIEGKTGYKTPIITIKTVIGFDGNPAWVTKPPKGKAFFASVGSIHQTTDPSTAFFNADTNAIGTIASLVVKPSIVGKNSTYEIVLKGIYIARRWYNPSKKIYYSLAILPR